MKRIFSILAALAATFTLGAQNIAVVSPNNTTSIYQTLDDAITSADPGSTIYLPGGGFTIKDETKVDKKLTIMGVSHRGDADNVDGATIISGNLYFMEGSSGSAVVGVYVSGNIEIGIESATVENFTLRYCNVNTVYVRNNSCVGLVVNQCYLRQGMDGGNCNIKMENCITGTLINIIGGIINHNVFVSNNGPSGGWYRWILGNVSSSTITNNIFIGWGDGHNGNNCYVSNNCIGTGTWGENPVVAPEIPEGKNVWDVLFGEGNNKGATIASDYHVKASWAKGAATDGTDIGIYGGSGFSEETSLAPIPRIVSKTVEEQSDASGRLKVTVTVKSK